MHAWCGWLAHDWHRGCVNGTGGWCMDGAAVVGHGAGGWCMDGEDAGAWMVQRLSGMVRVAGEGSWCPVCLCTMPGSLNAVCMARLGLHGAPGAAWRAWGCMARLGLHGAPGVAWHARLVDTACLGFACHGRVVDMASLWLHGTGHAMVTCPVSMQHGTQGPLGCVTCHVSALLKRLCGQGFVQTDSTRRM
eukprot:366276-Chlamydomonas_euryale.AAC.8